MRIPAAYLIRVLTAVSVLFISLPFSFASNAKTHPPSLRAKQIRLRLPGSPKEQSLIFRNPTAADLEQWSVRKRQPISERSFGLAEYDDVILHTRGSSEVVSALASGEAIPLTLIQGDFTRDQIPDLITGFRTDNGGIITVRSGLAEVLFPQQADWFIRPIIPFGEAVAFSVPVAPVLMVTGDVNRDGLLDIAISDKKTNGIYVIPGDKRTILGTPVLITLPSSPTTILSSDLGRIDGRIDLVVATEQDAGAAVFIFQNPEGAVTGSPDQLHLDQSVEAMESQRNADSGNDLVLTTAHQRVVLSHIMETGLVRTDIEISSTQLLEDRSSKGFANQGFSFMVLAELNGDEFRELILIDGTSNNLSIIRGREDTTFKQPDSYTMDGAPVAVLPMRLNPMAVDGLVVLKANGSLSYVVPPPDAIIGVNTIADDATVGGTVNAFISLREAILINNGGTGGDGLTTGLGRALTTGACPGAFETCNIFGAFGFGIADMIVFNNTAFPVGGGTIPISGPAARRALPPIRDGATVIDATVACPGPPTVPNCSGVLPGPVTITPLVPVTLAASDDGLSIQTSFNTVRGLNIKLFPDDGIEIPLGSSNKIEACTIGIAGGNGGDGVDDTGSTTTVGGATSAQRNFISGNLGNGIIARNPGIVIQNNFIGTDVAGTFSLANSLHGISLVAAATDATIGGVGKGNTISGNGSIGISSASNNALIQGNIIGRDSTNSSDVPNGSDGINISGRGNTIGGATAGTENSIRGNFQDGIQLSGTQNFITRNNIPGASGFYIGGNGRHGIFVLGNTNQIGTPAAGAGNLIQGNAISGVRIEASSSTVIQGNTIEANTQNGIEIDITSNTNTIGGNLSGSGNIIDANGGAGVLVESGTANPILANSIFANSGLGIELAPIGVTPNDTGDGDTGPNNLQNFPVLTEALTGSSTVIKGTLNSTINGTFTIEFYSNGACDPSGNGQGQTFLGSTTATTNATGNANFSFTSPTVVSAGQFITSTATIAGNTSEFSQCLVVTTCTVLTLTSPPLPNGLVSVAYNTSLAAAGGVAPFTFAVTSGALPDGLILSSTGVITGTPTTTGTFNFTVTATDVNGCTGNQAYSITISCGTIALTPTTLPAPAVGVAYNQTLTASGGTAPFTFSVTTGSLPNGLALSSGGVISGTPTNTGSVTFIITATDINGCPGTRSYTVNVACGTETISPATVPNGTVAVPYNQTLTAAGGTAPFSFAVVTGALPNGLILVSGGTITGTPTTPGAFVFTVRVTDANACTGNRAYSIDIACGTITLSPVTLPNGSLTSAYDQNLTAAGGTAPFSFAVTVGNLPDGLTLSSAGSITGTPTASGTFDFTVSVTDTNGCTGNQDYTIVVNCGGISISPTTLPAPSLGVAYSQNLTASGGTAPITFSVTTGNLPDGLTLSSAGAITGTPTTLGDFNFTVTATDALGCIGSQAYTLSVLPISFLLFDNFEGGSPLWDVTKGTWSQSNGNLIGTGNNKAIAFAPIPWDPSGFSGCSTCNIQIDDVVLGNGVTATILGWFADNQNKVELILKKGKVTLKQKVAGTTVLNESASASITEGIPFDAKLSFDGVQFEVIVGGVSVLQESTSIAPNGKVGLQVKSGTATFAEIRVE